ncbi:hypothetical protein [Streptosporangium lutulentum]|uniref:Uncharacterized protein n=1 Tax=Streptosporangium lutulentum TaxID=1461250 RepID=A0ABT9QBB9_9ACTN|nr:hypothetical protein [Streptosporangium lutulentum]MDP9843219.1 hypothetical protein [Streptosporangium lutulentum]
MEINFGLVLGGVVVCAICLTPAIVVMKHQKLFRKIHFLVAIAMICAGVGLIGIVAWLVSVGMAWGLTVWIGVIAVIALIVVVIAVIIGVSDWDIGRPEQWGLFTLPALITIVVMTSGATFSYFAEQFGSNVDTLKTQVERSQ